MSVALLIIGIICMVIGFITQIAELAWPGFAVGLIGFIWLIIESTIKTKKAAKEAEEQSQKFWADLKVQNQLEIDDYLKWINENYTVSKFIAFDKDVAWHKDKVVAVDEKNKVIIFGRKVIKFENILHAELKTSTSHQTTTDTQKNNPVGRAVVGGIIAGGVGAVIGATSAKETSTSRTTMTTHTDGIIIYLADMNEPVFKYSFVCDENNREIYATLLAIIAINSKTEHQ